MKNKNLLLQESWDDLSIREMSPSEFQEFIDWKINIVNVEMGLTPTEECIIGMWAMWKHLNKPVDEDKLDHIADEYVEGGWNHMDMASRRDFKAGYRYKATGKWTK